MKYIIFICLTFHSINTFSQNTSYEKLLQRTHGLKRGDLVYFEVEGYDISTYMAENLYYNKSGFKKAKRKLKIDKNNLGHIDSLLKVNHHCFITNYEIENGQSQQVIYYFVFDSFKLKIISFVRTFERNKEIERFFVEKICNNSIPENVFTQPNTDSVEFVGRYLYLGGACSWMGPHNVQCPDFGQINWSELNSLEDSKKYIFGHFHNNSNNGKGVVISKDSIDVVFEEVETKALKVKYKINIPQFVMGGSNILIVFYVATEIRGRYIGCVMSQFTDDINANKLAPLIAEIMELK